MAPLFSSQSTGEPTLALNLCDIVGGPVPGATAMAEVFSSLFDQATLEVGGRRFERIYVGSYYCDRFFTALSDPFFAAVGEFAARKDAALTLVAPIFGQRTLARGTELIDRLLQPGTPFDELVVNDHALAQRMNRRLAEAFSTVVERPRLVRGRLMAKGWRDPRYGAPEFPVPLPLDARQAAVEDTSWHPVLAECDPYAPLIDASPLDGVLPLALHLPHAMLTTGHICRAASIGLEPSKAFRAGAPCRRQCLGGIDVYCGGNLVDGRPVYLTQQGRTVFFENPDCRVMGAPVERVVWTPGDFGCPTAEEGTISWE